MDTKTSIEVNVLKFDLQELENALRHLDRSNMELEVALQSEPNDRDYIDAIVWKYISYHIYNEYVFSIYCVIKMLILLYLLLFPGRKQGNVQL